MATRSALLRVHDMLESIHGIEKALAGKSLRDYERSWLHKDVRWKDIAGIGNVLRHDYRRIDAAIIWRAVKDDLPQLKEALLALKESLE
jgi:uncharacterized protein with HEPN domain